MLATINQPCGKCHNFPGDRGPGAERAVNGYKRCRESGAFVRAGGIRPLCDASRRIARKLVAAAPASKPKPEMPPKLCLCGCGQVVAQSRYYRRGHKPYPKIVQSEVPCACGCGEKVLTPSKDGRPTSFRRGHNRRVKP